MINATALRHPRTAWEIESALWRAIEYGAAIACTAAGKEIVSIVHDRSQVPAFSFYRGGQDVTAEFLRVLRSQ
jgi:hypothetical protein